MKFRISYAPYMAKQLGGPWCLCGPRGFTLGFWPSIPDAMKWLENNWDAALFMDTP